MAFSPCASCSRHVKASDAACPFCGAAIERALATRAPRPATMSRSRAAFFLGAAALSSTVAAAAIGCSAGDGTSCCPPYGHPIIDAGPAPDTGAAEDAGTTGDGSSATGDAAITDASDAAD